MAKTSGAGVTVTGTYHPTRADNTQRVTVALDAADSFISDAEHLRPTNYAPGLARTDVPSVLVYGTATLGISTTLR